jgi:hypothetical protein
MRMPLRPRPQSRLRRLRELVPLLGDRPLRLSPPLEVHREFYASLAQATSVSQGRSRPRWGLPAHLSTSRSWSTERSANSHMRHEARYERTRIWSSAQTTSPSAQIEVGLRVASRKRRSLRDPARSHFSRYVRREPRTREPVDAAARPRGAEVALLPRAPAAAGGAGEVGDEDPRGTRLRRRPPDPTSSVRPSRRFWRGSMRPLPASDLAGNGLGLGSRPRPHVLSRPVPSKLQQKSGRKGGRRDHERVSPFDVARLVTTGVVLSFAP